MGCIYGFGWGARRQDLRAAPLRQGLPKGLPMSRHKARNRHISDRARRDRRSPPRDRPEPRPPLPPSRSPSIRPGRDSPAPVRAAAATAGRCPQAPPAHGMCDRQFQGGGSGKAWRLRLGFRFPDLPPPSGPQLDLRHVGRRNPVMRRRRPARRDGPKNGRSVTTKRPPEPRAVSAFREPALRYCAAIGIRAIWHRCHSADNAPTR